MTTMRMAPLSTIGRQAFEFMDRRCLRSPHDVQRHGLMRISNPDFKKMYDSQMDFRSDENLRWQVAEFSYETL